MQDTQTHYQYLIMKLRGNQMTPAQNEEDSSKEYRLEDYPSHSTIIGNSFHCFQESRIARLEERQITTKESIQKLQDSIDQLSGNIMEQTVLLNTMLGKDNQEDTTKAYIISFIIAVSTIIISRFLHL